jgi:hypothetical protein
MLSVFPAQMIDRYRVNTRDTQQRHVSLQLQVNDLCRFHNTRHSGDCGKALLPGGNRPVSLLTCEATTKLNDAFPS